MRIALLMLLCGLPVIGMLRVVLRACGSRFEVRLLVCGSVLCCVVLLDWERGDG